MKRPGGTVEPLDIDKHANQLYNNLLIDNNGESWTYLPYGPFKVFEDFKKWLDSSNFDDNGNQKISLSAI